MERAWRERMDILKRAGLDYIDRTRWITPTAAHLPAAPLSTDTLTEETAPMPARSREDKLVQLDAVKAQVAGCEKCSVLCQSRTQTVFADGDPFAELCFVGEAPGADEDIRGIPFVGKAGQLLTKIIEACKLDRSEVYICNVLKCRPPQNRNPMPDEIANCRPYLDRQLDLVRPKMMVALGKFAAAHLLCETPDKVPITKLRGTVHAYRGIPFMITLHPAYLLRNPAAKRDVWDDMKEVMRRLGRPIDSV